MDDDQSGQIANAASAAVFDTAELLEAILMSLSIKDVARLRRVRRKWYGIIEESPTLMKRLFMKDTGVRQYLVYDKTRHFEHDPSAYKGYHFLSPTPDEQHGLIVAVNPMLRVMRSDTIGRATSVCDELRKWSLRVMPVDISKMLNLSPEGSWRKQFLTQPPTIADVRVAIQLSWRTLPATRNFLQQITHATVDFVYGAPGLEPGVRMGDIQDLVLYCLQEREVPYGDRTRTWGDDLPLWSCECATWRGRDGRPWLWKRGGRFVRDWARNRSRESEDLLRVAISIDGCVWEETQYVQEAKPDVEAKAKAKAKAEARKKAEAAEQAALEDEMGKVPLAEVKKRSAGG